MYTIVLLVERAVSPHDAAQLAGLHSDVPTRFVAVIPTNEDSRKLVDVLDDLALGRFRDPARGAETAGVPEHVSAGVADRALADTLAALQAAGVSATGEVARKDPLVAVVAAAREHDADEVIVMTEPHLVEELLHRDWASRARRALELPVLKLLAHG